jgi:hypothetical protein
MTEKIFCKECGLLLYFGEIIEHRLYMCAIPSEKSVLEMYNNTCPKCKHTLDPDSVRVEVEEAPWMSR